MGFIAIEIIGLMLEKLYVEHYQVSTYEQLYGFDLSSWLELGHRPHMKCKVVLHILMALCIRLRHNICGMNILI
jgi:hypothetical protein